MDGAHVAVVGAGVGGLGAALALGRRGHRVTLLERDDTPLPADPAGAFDWNRRGAPQVRHTHAFLARLRNLLRDHYPDVLADLLAAGATEMDFIEMLPEGMDRTRQPGDEDLVALSCRRTTFEWVLHRAVVAQPGVEFRHGVGVTRLVGDSGTITGVECSDGTVVHADLVVHAGGRRSRIPELLAPLGVDIVETVEDTGIVYYSRFYELCEGADYPVQSGPIGGDLGYLKYGVFLGDNRTFSITLAALARDDELRSSLVDPEVFTRAAAALPATAAYVADGLARPITGVNVMAGLLNRTRRFVDPDGQPLVRGFVAVGDAHTCTNPLYGRGCSLAIVQAHLLAEALSEHPDPGEAAAAYERASGREILPWYRAAVAQDAETRRLSERVSSPDPESATDAPESGGFSMRELLRDGLFPAMREDPVVIRAFLRMFNLLDPPDALMTNLDVINRVMRVYQERDQRPPEPALGPDRSAMLAVIRAA